MSPEDRFVRELEQFRRDSDTAVLCLYAWQSFRKFAQKDRSRRIAINRCALFWNTNLAALQASLFISLGRIFDNDPKSHCISRLLREAVQNPQIFSRASLAARKQRQSPEASWIKAYVQEAYEPTKADFQRLDRYVVAKRKVYEKAYEDIRHKVFAHGGAASTEKKNALFARTRLDELQRLVLSLKAFHEAIWQLYFNGIKPALRTGKYSANSMRRKIADLPINAPIEERIFAETQSALDFYVAGATKSRIT